MKSEPIKNNLCPICGEGKIDDKLCEKCKSKTDAEISQEFLEKYRKLCRRYKRDFLQRPPEIVKLDFVEEPKVPPKNPAINIKKN